jgi:DNA-binding MarR family transcriptional regulator
MNYQDNASRTEYPVWLILLKTAQRLEVRLEAALSETSLSLPKLAVLTQLVKADGPLPLSRLAETLACVKSNVTQLVDRLESEGFVERVNDANDRRIVLAQITKEGNRRYKIGSQILADLEKDLLRGISKEEEDRLRASLLKIGEESRDNIKAKTGVNGRP